MKLLARLSCLCLSERHTSMEVSSQRSAGANGLLEIKPFHLYHNTEERHLDPAHMLLCWMRECRVQDGFIFRRFMANDRISAENKPLVSTPARPANISFTNSQSQDLFGEYFRHNM